MAQSTRVGKSGKTTEPQAERSSATPDNAGTTWSGIAAGLAVANAGHADHQHSHQRPGGLAALHRQAAGTAAGPIRRMKVGGKATDATVSGTTRKKHVAATGAQQAIATAEFGSMTFVTSDQVLVDAVKANAHNFDSGPGRSDRVDVEITVPIYQWEKTNPPPAGMAKGQPSSKTIDGVATKCEVGVVKTGDDSLSITHFKKL
jgi:hypothetical protein